jgi:hypothetical protein
VNWRSTPAWGAEYEEQELSGMNWHSTPATEAEYRELAFNPGHGSCVA